MLLSFFFNHTIGVALAYFTNRNWQNLFDQDFPFFQLIPVSCYIQTNVFLTFFIELIELGKASILKYLHGRLWKGESLRVARIHQIFPWLRLKVK